MFGEEKIASQEPLKAELKFNVWIVSGSPESDAALFAFILKKDGRILSVGPWVDPASHALQRYALSADRSHPSAGTRRKRGNPSESLEVTAEKVHVLIANHQVEVEWQTTGRVVA